MKYHENILELIGNTPLVKLSRVAQGVKPMILAKVETLNPGGSVKDRIGIRMIEEAERRGDLKPGGTIIENTSGNTGVGLALTAAVKGYKCIFTMPDKMSQEKINLLKAYGAEVIVTPTAVAPESPNSYYSVAKRLSEEIPNSYYPNQYFNDDNPQTHTETTGPEIWNALDGKIDAFVAGMGTGGTITGVGRYLKSKNPKIRIIGADPIGSVFYDYFHRKEVVEAQSYKVEGIGEDIFPTTLDFDVLDDVIQVGDKESFNWARRMAREEGIVTGGSAGSALCAALQVAKGMEYGQTIVVLLPDTGDRYLSKFYNDEWMKENQFLSEKTEITAEQVLEQKGSSRPLVTVTAHDLMLKAITCMRDQEISQIPVIEDGKVLGSLKEDKMIQLLIHNNGVDGLRVENAMDPPLPIVNRDVTIDVVSDLLASHNPAVLVKLADNSYDILTKYDLIHSMTHAQGKQ